VTAAWPLFDLRIRTARLELRAPTDEDLMSLAALAALGVHDPAEMPFIVPWTDLRSPEFERSFLRFYWGTRASWSPDDWHLPLVVLLDGEPVGVQGIGAMAFRVRRVVETGSWLGLEHQGRGMGTEMRAAVLHLAFAGLEAVAAESAAVAGNVSSTRVSEKLGYRPNGTQVVAPRGEPVEQRRYLLLREHWQPELYPTTIEGLEDCRDMFLGRGEGEPER
jgi:RimJ/RimL family protein N-acetyltransferase